MSSENQSLDPYVAVLADLRAQRDKIDQAIQLIESLRGGGAALAASSSAAASQDVAVNDPGAFLGMTIPDAARKLLAARRKTLSNSEIVTALKAGGLAMNSVDPINTVGSVLTRRFNTVGDIVRVGRGVWGLAEWYPNRSFKKKTPAKGDDPDVAPEQPAEPSSPEPVEASEDPFAKIFQ